MPRLLPLLSLALLLGACRAPAYVQPSPTQPHALLKVRHIVHARRGMHYGSAVNIGRFSVDERTLESVPTESTESGSETIHLRIHPTPDVYAVRGFSFHYEQRMVSRTRTVQEPYSCTERQCSGYGTSQRCSTMYRTCYRSRTEHYSEMATVAVTDDACGRTFPLAPRHGAVYLMQFDYLGENDCRLTCFEQVSQLDGTFRLEACPEAVVVQEGGRR